MTKIVDHSNAEIISFGLAKKNYLQLEKLDAKRKIKIRKHKQMPQKWFSLVFERLTMFKKCLEWGAHTKVSHANACLMKRTCDYFLATALS